MDARLKPIYLFAALLLAVLLSVAAFFWNEARKEVLYLCGNFTPGIPEASVMAQLDTANLARYRVFDAPSGRRMEFYSPLGAGAAKCVIRLDSRGRVEQAGME